MMAKVEGMPLAALEQGVDWDWETFAEYLDRLDGNIAVNAGFLVGHCAIRRYVMGADAVGNEAQRRADRGDARRAAREALEAGGLGFSFTQSGIALRRRRRARGRRAGRPPTSSSRCAR